MHTNEQGSLFSSDELPPRVWRRRRRTRRTYSSPAGSVQEPFAEETFIFTDDRGTELRLCREVKSSKYDSAWKLRRPNGSEFVRLSTWRFQSHSFRDTDEVFYVLSPIAATRGTALLEVPTVVELTKIVDPDNTYVEATEEHAHLESLEGAVRSLKNALADKERLYGKLKHPEKSSKYEDVMRYVNYAYNRFSELGYSEEAAELAVNLWSPSMHARDLRDSVNAVVVA